MNGEYDMPTKTDIQFKYDLRKELTSINEKLELIEEGKIEKLKKVLENEKNVIETSLRD